MSFTSRVAQVDGAPADRDSNKNKRRKKKEIPSALVFRVPGCGAFECYGARTRGRDWGPGMSSGTGILRDVQPATSSQQATALGRHIPTAALIGVSSVETAAPNHIRAHCATSRAESRPPPFFSWSRHLFARLLTTGRTVCHNLLDGSLSVSDADDLKIGTIDLSFPLPPPPPTVSVPT